MSEFLNKLTLVENEQQANKNLLKNLEERLAKLELSKVR